jgi:AbrB family looped-hinge helix DNA binding protein
VLYFPFSEVTPAKAFFGKRGSNMPILGAKRQVTLPKELCDRLAVEPGDDLELFEHNGHITILKKQRGRSAGVLNPLGTDLRFSDEDSLQSTIEGYDGMTAPDLRALAPADLARLRDLLGQVRKTTAAASAAIDRALADVAASNARIEAMEQAATVQLRPSATSPKGSN